MEVVSRISARKLVEDSSFHLVLHIQPFRSNISISSIQAIVFYLHAAIVPSRIAQFSPVDLKEEGSFQYFSWKSYEGPFLHFGHIFSIIIELICIIYQ